jgi:phosphoribosylaminoimidazole-succinocarboxamide synthase
MKLLHSGKVRDLYADGDDVIMVASDRMSVYDVVLPTPVPDKGAILTQLSLWWFERLRDLVPNHVISATRVPPEWAGRAIRCRRLDMIKVECIARGYLAGLGLQSYRESGAISGVALPAWPRAPRCPGRSSRPPPRPTSASTMSSWTWARSPARSARRPPGSCAT